MSNEHEKITRLVRQRLRQLVRDTNASIRNHDDHWLIVFGADTEEEERAIERPPGGGSGVLADLERRNGSEQIELEWHGGSPRGEPRQLDLLRLASFLGFDAVLPIEDVQRHYNCFSAAWPCDLAIIDENEPEPHIAVLGVETRISMFSLDELHPETFGALLEQLLNALWSVEQFFNGDFDGDSQ